MSENFIKVGSHYQDGTCYACRLESLSSDDSIEIRKEKVTLSISIFDGYTFMSNSISLDPDSAIKFGQEIIRLANELK